MRLVASSSALLGRSVGQYRVRDSCSFAVGFRSDSAGLSLRLLAFVGSRPPKQDAKLRALGYIGFRVWGFGGLGV